MKNKSGRRWRMKQARDAAREDRLSKLPNDVLLNILERVDTLDAVRTCILSKRMIKLLAMHSNLFISTGSISTSSPCSLLRANRVVARVTEHVLATRNRDIAVTRLRIRFILKLREARRIGESVARAIVTQRVDATEFEILTDKNYNNSSHGDLVHSAKVFNMLLRACPGAFAGLTRLSLRNIRFGELDIPNILITCKCLEALRLSDCDSGVDSVLQVEHARLVELRIHYGYFMRVELTCLPRLQRVTYRNDWAYTSSYEDPICFHFVPLLSKLSLTRTDVDSDKPLQLSHLLANVPSIDDLRLDFRSEKIWVLPECSKLLMPVLSKLRYATLDNLSEGCDIAWTMFILEAATSLKELCITVWDHWCIIVTNKEQRRKYGYCKKKDVEWESLASDFKHRSLVKLTIYGFQPDNNFLRYIRRVIGVAVNLADISLYDRKACGKNCGDLGPEIEVCPSRYPRTVEERKHTTDGLGLASPEMVHFRS